MNDTRYITIQGRGMRSFIFQAQLEQDSDGRWSAGIDTLLGCASWGFTKKQGIDDALIQPYSGHATRKSLEVYSLLAIREAQEAYDEVIDRFPL